MNGRVLSELLQNAVHYYYWQFCIRYTTFSLINIKFHVVFFYRYFTSIQCAYRSHFRVKFVCRAFSVFYHFVASSTRANYGCGDIVFKPPISVDLHVRRVAHSSSVPYKILCDPSLINAENALLGRDRHFFRNPFEYLLNR